MMRPLQIRRRQPRDPQAGMTLIELMIAALVLVVGMMGGMLLIVVAINSNARNKHDTTGTMLAQMVIEQIIVMPTNSGVTTIPVTDCNDKAWNISVVASNLTGGAGATLVTDTSSPMYQRVDWSQDYDSIADGYKMKYFTCGGVEYEVRWNVFQLTNLTKMINVSARQVGATQGNIRLFAPPVSLRTISGP